MFGMIQKFSLVSIFALLLAIMLSVSRPFSATSYAASRSATSHLSSDIPFATSTGVTTSWANVRTDTNTSAQIDHVDAPSTTVTIYATVSGQVAWGGIFSRVGLWLRGLEKRAEEVA